MCAEETEQFVKELLDRYGREPVSKTKLVMALHYFMRDKCDACSRNFGSIDQRVGELINEGALQEVGAQSYVVA